MEGESNNPEVSHEVPIEPVEKAPVLHTVTPLSKYLAMLLFIAMPFIGGWVGYTYAPDKVVYVEMAVENPLKENLRAHRGEDLPFGLPLFPSELVWNESLEGEAYEVSYGALDDRYDFGTIPVTGKYYRATGLMEGVSSVNYVKVYEDILLSSDGWSADFDYQGYSYATVYADGPLGSLWRIFKEVNGKIVVIVLSHTTDSNCTEPANDAPFRVNWPCNREYEIFISDPFFPIGTDVNLGTRFQVSLSNIDEESTSVVGTEICPIPAIQTADILITINDQSEIIPGFGVPAQVVGVWPTVPMPVMAGMGYFAIEQKELSPAFRAGEQMVIIPDYSSLQVVEYQARILNGEGDVVDGNLCQYEFERVKAFYYYEGTLIEDREGVQAIGLDRIIQISRQYDLIPEEFKLHCFNGCG